MEQLAFLIPRLIQHADTHPVVQIPKKEHYAVQKACDYIHDRAAEGITLTDIAEHVGLSRYYLLRVFREEIGMPPYAYLESVRISKAKQLLESGLPFTGVALELGFSDQSHFTNCFKRLTGVTPGQYVHTNSHSNR